MNILLDARILAYVLRDHGVRAAANVFVRGLQAGSVLYWLAVAGLIGLALGWFTADFGVVPK